MPLLKTFKAICLKEKLDLGLEKTKTSLFDKISKAIAGKSSIDDDFLDKLEEIFNNDRKSFEEKWESLGLFVKYGMITDDKFLEKANKFLKELTPTLPKTLRPLSFEAICNF
mgnify:CR=1 FL=1